MAARCLRLLHWFAEQNIWTPRLWPSLIRRLPWLHGLHAALPCPVLPCAPARRRRLARFFPRFFAPGLVSRYGRAERSHFSAPAIRSAPSGYSLRFAHSPSGPHITCRAPVGLVPSCLHTLCIPSAPPSAHHFLPRCGRFLHLVPIRPSLLLRVHSSNLGACLSWAVTCSLK